MIKRVLRFCIRPVNVNLVVMLPLVSATGFILHLLIPIPIIFYPIAVIVARVIYSSEKSDNIKGYRIIMGFCYFISLFCMFFIFIACFGADGATWLSRLACIALFLLYIMCIINTYTKRILK